MADSQPDILSRNEFVTWFRGSSPYIHAHRKRTFVVLFSGKAVQDNNFSNYVHDFALLNSLGVRLILVHGIRPQIEQRLSALGASSNYHNGIRITDGQSLQCVKEAAGIVRVELEALLSMGLSNSPMAGAEIRVASGNFITAKPFGVIDGIDMGFAGEVRKIDIDALNQLLEQDKVIIISPIGYSPTGEIFNLCADNVAANVATELKADKLLILSENQPPLTADGELVRQLTTDEAQNMLTTAEHLNPNTQRDIRTSVAACKSGVARTHLIQRKIDGAILLELFTRDGVGTLISCAPFEELRPGTLSDIRGILDLIVPLEQKGVLVKRSRELLETQIKFFSVMERDGLILGCAAIRTFTNETSGELACVAVHPTYRNEARGSRLLDHIETQARDLGLKKLFVLTTQTTHWFREHGFEATTTAELPDDRQALYNFQRNSKVLVKTL